MPDNRFSKKRKSGNPWKRFQKRPSVVSVPGVLLVLLSGLSIAGAPFLLIIQQIQVGPTGSRDPLTWLMVGCQVLISALLIFFGMKILQGRGWARWAYAGVGALLLVAAGLFFPLIYAATAMVIYAALLVPLFHRKAQHYFGD